MRFFLKIFLFSISVHCAILRTTEKAPERTTKCLHYNDTFCADPTGCQDTIVECENTSQGPNQCFVLWKNNVNGTSTLKSKGCFSAPSKDCLGEKRCVDRGNIRPVVQLLFCCCEGDLCNSDYAWEPTPAPPTKPPSTNSGANTASYLIYIIIPISMIVFLIAMVLCRKRKLPFFCQISNLDHRRSMAHSEKLRPIQLLDVVASGKFGAVWRATLKGETIAVKIMTNQEKHTWRTEQEVFRIPSMNHENVVRFIAAERRGDSVRKEYWIITAYHKQGSLLDYLKENVISWEQLCHISYTMAKGLAHLHEELPSEKIELYKPAIAHRDFKSSNVLLKDDMSACIADFGLALIFHPTKSCGDAHGQVGTRRYMAPEVLEGAINFSRDSFLRIDMYAFGLVLWELASRCTFEGDARDDVDDYKLPFVAEIGLRPALEDIQEVVVHKKQRPVVKSAWKEKPACQLFCETMEECWDHDAEARLSASCVMERMSWNVKVRKPSLEIPPSNGGGGGLVVLGSGEADADDNSTTSPLLTNTNSSVSYVSSSLGEESAASRSDERPSNADSR